MDTWYLALVLAIVAVVLLGLWVRDRIRAKHVEQAKQFRKAASKAKRKASAARKVDLALNAEQQARAEGMINSTGTQNAGTNDATWPWGNT